MEKIISTDIVIAYFHCPRKAFLLTSGEQGAEVEYISILNEQMDSQKARYINGIKPTKANVQISKPNDLRNGGSILENVTLKSENLEARCNILIRDSKAISQKKTNYEPTVFIGTHNIGKEHKKIVSPLQEWSSFPVSQPPAIILNKHCVYCQFQKSCRSRAEESDNLSQLSEMNVRKIKQYEKKGIFTIKQLSYSFKPRRLKKRARNHQKTHKPELRALAIRTGKIYIQELPNLSRQNIELFIDIEGVPDQNLYYLFGLLVRDGDKSTYYPFWADTDDDEFFAWQKFVDEINKYPQCVNLSLRKLRLQIYSISFKKIRKRK